MNTHVVKGWILGYTLLANLLGRLFSIPFSLIDHFVALFYQPYFSYWEQNSTLSFQGTRYGVVAVFGAGIGELIGYIVGAPLGACVGLALYFPDLALRGLSYFHAQAKHYLNAFATMVGNYPLFASFSPVRNPQSNWDKAWNIAAGSVGVAVAAICWAPVRLAESLLPFLGNGISNFIWKFAGKITTTLVAVAGLLVVPVNYLCNNFFGLFHAFRERVREASALVYAKNNIDPDKSNCNPSDHSDEFKAKVRDYNARTTTAILFGELIRDEIVIAVRPGLLPVNVAQPRAPKPLVQIDAPRPVLLPVNAVQPSAPPHSIPGGIDVSEPQVEGLVRK